MRLAYAPVWEPAGRRGHRPGRYLRAFRDWDRIRQPSAWVRKVTVRRAGRTVHRRVLEATAVARLLAGRGPAVAEPRGGRPGVAGRQGPARRQSQVIALRYVADASVAEIAQTLGLAGDGQGPSTGAARLAVRLATSWEVDRD